MVRGLREGPRMKAQWLAVMKEARVPKRYRLRVRERLVVLEYA
jgi:hypothetical protein